MPDRVIASVPGRVCLAGEDIDWISGPSILCAIDRRVTVTVSPLPDASGSILLTSGAPFDVQKRVGFEALGDYNREVLDYVQAAVKLLVDRGLNVTPLHVSVSTMLPPRAGLASSAAVVLATLAAVSSYCGRPYSTTELCDLGYSVESEELGTGAGQMDFYGCGFGGLLYVDSRLRPPSEIQPFDVPEDITIVVADTLARRSTADVIRTKRARLRDGEEGIMSYVRETEAAIREMRDVLARRPVDLVRLGALVTACHRHLADDMRVSTSLLDACVEASLRGSALGAKLTGTGMGGCAFAMVDSFHTPDVIRSLDELKIPVYATSISAAGLRVHSE